MRSFVTSPLILALTLTWSACAQEGEESAIEASPPAITSSTPDKPARAVDIEQPIVQRRAMSDTERRAIAEARSRHLPMQRSTTERSLSSDAEPKEEALAGSTLVGAAAEDETGLTPVEMQAALDDPAANLPKATQAPKAEDAKNTAEAQAKKGLAAGPRQGVKLGAASEGIKLLDLAIATEVKKREPLGISASFAVMPKRFHCFCVFENRHAPTQVTHVWKRNGRVVSRVELEVGKSPKWRTWSRQRLKPSWTGEWTCEVESKKGRTLGVATVSSGP